VLLLDLAAPADVRAKALADARSQLQSGGEVILEQDWGERALAYPIDHRENADYHLLQFHADAPVIDALERSLRIADGVVRHRIIKLAPGTPAPPEQSKRAPAAAEPATAPAPIAAEAEADADADEAEAVVAAS
jgi:small subunit ribosomal protein S6